MVVVKLVLNVKGPLLLVEDTRADESCMARVLHLRNCKRTVWRQNQRRKTPKRWASLARRQVSACTALYQGSLRIQIYI